MHRALPGRRFLASVHVHPDGSADSMNDISLCSLKCFGTEVLIIPLKPLRHTRVSQRFQLGEQKRNGQGFSQMALGGERRDLTNRFARLRTRSQTSTKCALKGELALQAPASPSREFRHTSALGHDGCRAPRPYFITSKQGPW